MLAQAGCEPFRGAHAPSRVAVGALADRIFAFLRRFYIWGERDQPAQRASLLLF